MSNPYHSDTLQLGDATLYYSLAGAEHDTPIVVLHGGRGQGDHGAVFDAHLPLADGYRVIGYDMRGHGRSSVTAPFTFDQFVEDLEQVRLTLGGGQKMILHGGSFGGFIALRYAVKYPQHLAGLVLRGTAPSWHHERDAVANFTARAATRAPMATRAMLEKIFTPTLIDDEEFRLIMFALLPLYSPSGVTVDHDRLLEQMRTRVCRAQVHNDLYREAVWHTYDVIAQLPTISCPTLVICGAEDWICDPAQSRLIAQGIPGAQLVEVAGVDHTIPADRLLAHTRAFVQQVGPRQRVQ